jgi:hypothetical protein
MDLLAVIVISLSVLGILAVLIIRNIEPECKEARWGNINYFLVFILLAIVLTI